MRKDQLTIRLPHILKKMLLEKENMSEFVNKAIENELRAERNPRYKQAKTRELKKLKDEIKEMEGISDIDTDIIIEGFYSTYQERVSIGATPSMLKNWIKGRIKPSLTKIGYHGSVEDILNLFKEYKS